MAVKESHNPHIIGLTGSFGSGCTYIAENILRDKAGYRFLSLSKNILRPIYQKVTGQEADKAPRSALQAFGDKVRQERGLDCFAKEAIEIIQKDTGVNKWVVDSIRNPAEIRILRRFSREFFLVGVYAEKQKRWDRSSVKYQNNKTAFDEDDQNDTGDDNLPYGQHVGDCFYEADVVIVNNENFVTIGNQSFDNFAAQLTPYIELIQKPLRRQRPISQDEALMAIAYAMSQRSSCQKRKVGAIIVDENGNVISSGYNEVPMHETPCDEKYKKCYREWLSDQFFENVSSELGSPKIDATKLRSLFRKQFKNLDYCRALHAEENAIINIARHGTSIDLETCTLYTTTYPCRMCANKIVNVGIKQVVYLEPYPDQSAKSILGQANVKDRFFQGVTFRAYFRLYGEER
jgi:deoxycytidylate deaminase/dephospho-CoA kinase